MPALKKKRGRPPASKKSPAKAARRKEGRPADEKRIDKPELRRMIRAEIADKHPGSGSEMTPKAVFRLNTAQLWYLDKALTNIFNQVRSHIENNIVVQSPRYSEVLEARRNENIEPKKMETVADQEMENKRAKEEMTRRKTASAKLVKEVLAGQLGMTAPEAQALVYNMAVNEAERRVAYNAMKLAMEAQLKECSDYMETLAIWGTKDDPGWLRSVKGIGTKLGAKLLCIVGDTGGSRGRPVCGPISEWGTRARRGASEETSCTTTPRAGP